MATKRARAKDILTALRGDVADDTLLAHTLDVFAKRYAPDKLDLTLEQKAGVFLRAVRSFARDTVHSDDVREAQEQARLTIQPPDMGTD